MKFWKPFLLITSSALTISPFSLISCAKSNNTYQLYIGCSEGVEITKRPKDVTKGKDCVIEFSFDDVLYNVQCVVRCERSDITEQCSITNTKITIPGSSINGIIIVLLSLEEKGFAFKFVAGDDNISFPQDTYTFDRFPTRAFTYWIKPNYEIDTIKLNGESLSLDWFFGADKPDTNVFFMDEELKHKFAPEQENVLTFSTKKRSTELKTFFESDDWSTLISKNNDIVEFANYYCESEASNEEQAIANIKRDLVGRNRELSFDGHQYRVRLIDCRHDLLVDSEAKANLTFEFVDVPIEDPPIIYNDKEDSCWYENDGHYCLAYYYCNNTLFEKMPSVIMTAIKTVDKETSESFDPPSNGLIHSYNKMFIPSKLEYGDDMCYGGTEYTYYSNLPKKDKTPERVRFLENSPITIAARDGSSQKLLTGINPDGSLMQASFGAFGWQFAPCFCI
ncbi:MAG: hypothetical protein ACOQNV_00600 [Mycoplasmoidaceae bacterium]